MVVLRYLSSAPPGVAAPRAGMSPLLTIASQVASSRTPVTATPFLLCQVRSAALVAGPKTPSAVTPMTFWASWTSGPDAPSRRVGYEVASGSGTTGPPGPWVTPVHAAPVHHDVRCIAPSQLKLKWMWSVCGLLPL